MQLTYPGVYTRELPSGSRSLGGAPTSVALFIGPTLTGIDNRPTRIQNFGDFTRAFGGLSARSALSYSVLHFFTNGGGEAQVIRLPPEGAARAASAFLRAGTSEAAFKLTALSSALPRTASMQPLTVWGWNLPPAKAPIPICST